MGHTDMLVIADCGLPVPDTTRKIDIALTRGVPSFLDTLGTVLTELAVEEAIVADEFPVKSPELFAAMKERLVGIPIRFVPHCELKAMTASSKACIRTGEQTPYANVILKSNVTF